MARYEIVPEASTVWIDASSSLHPIHSEVRGLTGFVEIGAGDDGVIDLSAAPSGRLSLDVDRLSSGNPVYDAEMKRRVDARAFPTITGELTSMAPADGEHAFVVGGAVTFKGVTKSYEDSMSVVAKEDMVLLEGSHTFDVRDFGLQPPRILMLRVHPDVVVRVEIAARRPAPS